MTLTGNPDYETKPSYSFTVVATDAAANASERAVSLAIGNLDDSAPTITSGATAAAIGENTGPGQVIYTATATDSGDISGGVTFDLKPGSDLGLTINHTTGAVTLTGNPDYETQASYSFTIVATDAAANFSERAVSLAINDVMENRAPTVSGLVFSATGLTFTATDPDVISPNTDLSYAAPFNSGFGTVADGSLTTFTAVSQSVVKLGTLRVIDGGTPSLGVDVAYVALGTSGANTFDASTSSLRAGLYGFIGNDTLIGSAQADYLSGGSGLDFLSGGAGADILDAGSGNDILVAEDTDTLIDGGTHSSGGADIVRFAAAVSATNLLDADLINVEAIEITNTAGARYDFSAQTEALVITGNIGNDIILGGRGKDTINLTAGGNDRLVLGSSLATNGSDTISGFAAVVTSRDILDFSAQGLTGSIERGTGGSNGGVFVGAISSFGDNDTANVLLDGKIALIDATLNTGGSIAEVDSASEIAALINGSVFNLSANSKSILISGSSGLGGGTASSTVYVWEVVNNGTTTIASSEVRLLATMPLTSGTLASFDAASIKLAVSSDVYFGPSADTNPAPSNLLQSAAAGTQVGITALATDLDPGDSISYSINDARFAINSVTGVVTRSGVGLLDGINEPLITVAIMATSSDGSLAEKYFTISVKDYSYTASDVLFRFAVFGDFGNAEQSGEQAVAALVNSWNVDFILTTGDNSYDSVPYDQAVGQQYSNYIGDYVGSYGAGSSLNRFFPTLGNHDYAEIGVQNYLNYFTLPDNERYYDFQIGSIHFFALDSNSSTPDGRTANSVQGQWYQAAAAESQSTFNITYFHHAPYLATGDGTVELQWDFEGADADVVFTGHVHDVFRINRDADGDGVQLPYITSGLGGEETDLGATLVTVFNNWLLIETYTPTGTLLDRYIVDAPAGSGALSNSGNDIMLGTAASDYLWGLAGDDTLTGFGGNDLLIGGTGNDTFVFGGAFGHDTVKDFAAGPVGGDILDLTAFGIDTVAEFQAIAVNQGAGVLATFSATESIYFAGVSVADFTDGDFAQMPLI